ncbi:MAG: PKD domain-containing protein [Nitrospirae bacterium]|nr:PKD domain-containing protein [Nitrospirota bacterium]
MTESNPNNFDMSSYDFAHSECGYCHPGGGSMEYDRAGYRYDGMGSEIVPGYDPFNPFATLFNPNRNSAYGDYFTFDPATGAIVDKAMDWENGGVAEVDCLMCHYAKQYSLLERNWAISESKMPSWAPSLGLVGSGVLNIAQKGAPGVNPNISRTGWSWTGLKIGSYTYAYAGINGLDIVKTPQPANCANCHFGDNSLVPKVELGQTCTTNPSLCGPAGVSLGLTVFQKYLAPGTVVDGDKVGAGTNDSAWYVVKDRVELAKRGESFNAPYDPTDPNNTKGRLVNPDIHLDKGMKCAECHYALGGEVDPDTGEPAPVRYPALTDSLGNVIQPAIDVFKVDHQFAKGNDVPDGRNMDQFDNTLTCESCHTTMTHQNLRYNASYGVYYMVQYDSSWNEMPYDPLTSRVSMVATHSGFPVFHFTVIDCRTCHSPEYNSVEKDILRDFTGGLYKGAERVQVISNPLGIHYKPLYIWRAKNHNDPTIMILPSSVLVVASWIRDGDPDKPVYQRTAQKAAEDYRAQIGDANLDGIYDWTLNRPQSGDTTLIVNTPAEIQGMVQQLIANGVSDPVMNLYVNVMNVSRNVAPKANNKILGSSASGGCVMCHSSSDPLSPNYTPRSVGFFNKTFTLFNQPNSGLMQTDLGDGIKRVNLKLQYTKADRSSAIIDLSNNAGEVVGNTINQGTVFGFTPARLAGLQDPATAGIVKPVASFSWGSDTITSLKVNFNASLSTCGSGNCTYLWDFTTDGTYDATGKTTSKIYGAAGYYNATLKVTDNTYEFSSTTTKTVQAKVINAPPTAVKTVTTSGLTATLVDSSYDAIDPQSALVVTITWGDGATDQIAGGASKTHTYLRGGIYTIRHKVTDTGGLYSFSPNVTVNVK